MMMPATAITGTTALMPMNGVRPTARITPVPNPPTAPTTPAVIASAATAASVTGSKSKLGARRRLGHRPRAPVAVDGDVGERRLRYLDHGRVRRPALCEHLDVDRDRGVADAHHFGIERE